MVLIITGQIEAIQSQSGCMNCTFLRVTDGNIIKSNFFGDNTTKRVSNTYS